MPDFSDIPDEAVEAAHDISWGGEQANRRHIRMMLAAALPALTADLVAEIEQKDTELEEWRTGVLRLPVDAATSDDDRPVCPCVTNDDYVHPSLRGEQ